MPLMMPCQELRPGMRFFESFIWRNRVMVTGNVELTGEDIGSLRLRFPEQSFRVIDPDLDEMVEFEDDSYEREVAKSAQQRVADCMQDVQMRFSRTASLGQVSLSTIHSAVVDVIKYLEDHPVSASLVSSFMNDQGYLGERAGNVFFLSMMLATSAKDYIADERKRLSTIRDMDPKTARSTVSLGLGAMLIDLGMLPLEEIYTQDAPLTPELWERVRDHPVAGAEMLPADSSPAAKMLVRTHHENMDGSGYPAGIPGNKLHVFSRIVRIADAYDAATSSQVYKEAMSPVRVLWEMTVGSYSRFYDPKLISIFARQIQPFPIGSKIRLLNGAYAVVVKYNRVEPLCPVMIIAFDSKNRRLSNQELSTPFRLGERPDVRAASFASEDLAYIYDNKPPELHRSRVGVWPSLFEASFP